MPTLGPERRSYYVPDEGGVGLNQVSLRFLMSSRVPLTSGNRLLTQAPRAEASHRPVAGREVTAVLVELAFVPRTILDMKWTGKNALDPDLEAFLMQRPTLAV